MLNNGHTSIIGIILVVATSFVFHASPIAAQEPSPSAEVESCFSYYQYGNMTVNLTAERSSYSSGETVTIHGTLVNNNTFPLRDVVLYAQLRRLNTGETFAQGGHYLVDRFPLQTDLNFLPKEIKAVTITLPIKQTYPAGAYKLQYFLLSKHGFHYAGRPFLEEDIAGSSQFDVIGAQSPDLYFDVSELWVNGQTQHIRDAITVYDNPQLTFHLSVIDRRDTKTDILVTLSYYAFEDTFDRYRVAQKKVVIPKGNTSLEDTFTPPYTGAYVMVASIAEPFASELKYRFAKKGTVSHELRINDMGVTDFPATGSARAYVCIHSPAREKTPDTTVTLQVLDSAKQMVAQKQYTASFSGALQALSVPLDKLATPENFWVQTNISWEDEQGKQTKEVLTQDDCGSFPNSTTDIEAHYDERQSLLSLQAAGTCARSTGDTGLVDSIRIVSENGALVKELYNQSVPKDILLTDIPAGRYTSTLTYGDKKITVPITIVGSRTSVGNTRYTLLLFALGCLSFVILLFLGRAYLRRRA